MSSNSVVTTKLFVGNVPEVLTSVKLRELCVPYGEVVECDVIKNYAFVHFAKEDDARGALAGLQGMSVGDRKLRTELSKSSVRQKPGMGSKDECFKCGGRGHWSKDCPSGRRGGRGGMRGRGGGGGGGGGGGPMRRGYGRDMYYEEYEGYYRRPSFEDRYDDRYDDYYRRRPYASDYYSYRDRSPYSRPPADYYSRGSSYYGFADDR